MSRKHIDLLDCARGVAILLVMLFHTTSATFGRDSLPWAGQLRDFSDAGQFAYFLPLSFGQLGVPLFFVISGFCIHLSCRRDNQKWSTFFVRRFFRIYPPYLAAAVLCAILLAAHHTPDTHSATTWRVWLTHLLMIYNFDSVSYSGLNGSFWSLAIEAQLYLIYPALLFLVGRFGWGRAMVGLAAVELAIRAGDWQPLAASPFGYWFSWSLGAFIADAALKGKQLPFFRTPATPFIMATIACYFFKPLLPFMFPLAAFSTAVAICRLMSRGVSGEKLAPLKAVGLWSYSLYLLHQPLLLFYAGGLAAIVPAGLHSPAIMFAVVLASWLLVIPFGVLWYKLVELPSIAVGKQIIHKTDEPGAAAFESQRSIELRKVNRPAVVSMAAALATLIVFSCWVSRAFTPNTPEEDNNLAWTLATDPDPAKRDGVKAVILAEGAVRRTHEQQTVMVGTLAAAYAEAGRFKDAVTTASNAVTLATERGETNLAERNQELLKLYQTHKPCRD